MSVYSIPPPRGTGADTWRDMLSQSHTPGDWFQGATDDVGDDDGQRETGVPYCGDAPEGPRQDHSRHVRPRPLPLRTTR